MSGGWGGNSGTHSYGTTAEDDSSIGRRECLKLVGIAAASTTGVAAGSDVARAASDGYGEGGYGEGPYGGGGLGVSTGDPAGVDATSATLEGELSDLDGADSADCYFEWRRTGASSWTATTAQTLSSTGSFSASLSGLEDGVDYEYRAVGSASDGDSATGNTVTFTTTDDAPTVTTDDPSDVTDSTATLNGSLSGLGNADSADCYFEWRRTGASDWTATTAQALSSTGSFSASPSGLEDGVDYEYRALVTASDGDTDSGSIVTFATTENSPTVTTDAPSNVADSGATLNGSLDDLGNADSADCYFEWRSVGASSWNTTTAQTLSATGSFSADVSGLSSSTDYECRAVGAASDGDTDTGATTSFTTDSGSTAPSVDSYSVTEAGSPNPHAEITADWGVSDADGDLDRVEVKVADASGTVLDATTTRVGGDSAGGTDSFKIKHADGQTFDVTVTVTDAAGNGDRQTRSVTE